MAGPAQPSSRSSPPVRRAAAPVLVFANKQDVPCAMSGAEVAQKMQLDTVCAGRKWHVQEASATAADGIYEGFDWLFRTVAGEAEGTEGADPVGTTSGRWWTGWF